MATLFLDLETFCETPIAHGAHVYAEKAEVLLIAAAWDDGEPEVFDGDHFHLRMLQSTLDDADEIVIHNSAFDRTVLTHRGVFVPVAKIYDTMAQALAHSLPGALDTLCEVLRVPFDKQKDKEGKKLIQLFCKPQSAKSKVRRATKETHPEKWAEFVGYARQDIVAMREVHKRLPRWNNTAFERHVWQLDQKINDRGVAIDLDLARSATRAAVAASGRLSARAAEMTGGEVASLTQRDKLIAYLVTEHSFDVDDLRKGTVNALLKGELPATVRELLENRLQASATSPAKYRVLLTGTSLDGRLRGTLQYCGAMRTGRWGGRLFQPQNLPRPTLPSDVVDLGIEAMKEDCEELIFPNVMEICQNAIRGCLVAAPGKKLVISDLSNIEGRVLAWLAGEEWKLEAFRAYDAGLGPDLYLLTAGAVLGKHHSEVTKKERQDNGKVPELACGFQGALGAFLTMAANYGLVLSDERAIEIVKAWRAANPNIVRFWYALENAVRAVLFDPEQRIDLPCNISIDIEYLDFAPDWPWLRIRLPSNRYLCYPGVHIGKFKFPRTDGAQEEKDNIIVYDGVNQYTRQWTKLPTYAGKIAENVTQAVARDTLARGMRKAEESGYPVVMHVHDELITEVPDDISYSEPGLSALLSENPPWAMGLPLAAAGFETHRYRKDG